MKNLLVFAITMLLFSCQEAPKQPTASSNAERIEPAKAIFTAQKEPEFNAYWYQGKAELNVYTVTQERYGALRDADQVSIFVTEDFSKSKQVKLDDPGQAGKDKVSVLKMNTVRRFVTGIYDYSLMQSVFTPINSKKEPASLKNTTSIQDWCGHLFSQINFRDGQYHTQLRSYFESEGDQDLEITADFFEDEIWNRIRLNPEGIQSGTYQVIPATFYMRMRHKPVQAAQLELSKPEPGVVLLNYPTLNRSLEIHYQEAFPHQILEWTEMEGGKLMSKGKQKTVQLVPYWQLNQPENKPMREDLMLNFLQ
jgi:hypothetical protein